MRIKVLLPKLSNLRSQLEISEVQIKHLENQVDVARHGVVSAWKDNTRHAIWDLRDAVKTHLLRSLKKIIEDNFEKNPVFNTALAVAYYKPLKQLSRTVDDIGGNATVNPEKQLVQIRESPEKIENLLRFAHLALSKT